METEKDTNQLLSEFVQYLDSIKMLEVTKGSNPQLKIDSVKLDYKNFPTFLMDVFREKEALKFRDLPLAFPNNNFFLDMLKRIVKNYLIEKLKRNSSSSGTGFLSFDFTELIPFVSVDKDNAITFVHEGTRQVVPASYKNYAQHVPKALQRTAIFGVIRFDPYSPEKLRKTTFENQPVNLINTYHPPSWQLPRELTLEEIKQYAKLPLIVDNFFRALFPKEESRQYVYDWLHFALTKRCQTYLVLNGAKGIGKGIFTDTLCQRLIGEKNWKQANKDAVKSDFNAMLVDTRMIIFDEMPLNDDEKMATLKKYINDIQAVQFKGVDTVGSVMTYNSFIISSNKVTDIRIEWDDRRFSVVDISEVKLNEVWSKDTIKELVAALEDDDVMRNFGYWLMYRKPLGDEFSEYKGQHFWKLCYSSLPEWSKCVVDEVLSGEYDILDDETLKMKHRDRGSKFPFPQNAKVEDFIKSYQHQGMGSLGKFEKTDNGGFQIVVSDKFYKGRDTTGIKWVDPQEVELL